MNFNEIFVCCAQIYKKSGRHENKNYKIFQAGENIKNVNFFASIT